MKRLILLLVTSMIISSSHSQGKNFIDQPYVEVTGDADSLVVPDEIYLKIQLSEKDSKDRVSVEETETKMISSLKSIGINTETNLSASDMISKYRVYFLKQKDILKTKEYILKIADATTMSKVFEELEKLGISNISIDRVSHSNLDNIIIACKEKAVDKAKINAIALARPLGQKIGKAIYIAEPEHSFLNRLQGNAAGIQIRGVSSYSSKFQEIDNYSVDFKKIKISALVTVKFILD